MFGVPVSVCICIVLVFVAFRRVPCFLCVLGTGSKEAVAVAYMRGSAGVNHARHRGVFCF